MAFYQVVIHETVSHVVAVEADSPEAARASAMDKLVNSNDPNEFYDAVLDREFVNTVETDVAGGYLIAEHNA